MTQFIPFSRDQAFLLPPDAKDWLPEDDVAHVVVAAVERVPLGVFAVRPIPGGKAQYHPRLLLALLIYSYANGIFSSRRIERATYRDIGVHYQPVGFGFRRMGGRLKAGGSRLPQAV